MRLSDFDFELPEELIAVRPARPRSAARLLAVEAGRLTDAGVTDLPSFLRPGDRLVLNDTRVIPVRLSGTRMREGGPEAQIESTLLEPRPDGTWRALVKPLRKLRPGDRIRFSERLWAEMVERSDETAVLRFDVSGEAFDAALAEAGAMPLPPYIAGRRAADVQDAEDYQTIWARRPGAVAAPTASLHFDAPLLEALRARGIETTHVTLHVGAGTFLPVKTDDPREHRMHGEWGELTEEAALAIAETGRAGGRVLPVGTTALRLIEAAAMGGEIAAFRGVTDIFIMPGFRFRVTDGLMTNFHLPRSTLMMLVSALMGTERMREVYAHAIAERYRFFSYGDASLLLPRGA